MTVLPECFRKLNLHRHYPEHELIQAGCTFICCITKPGHSFIAEMLLIDFQQCLPPTEVFVRGARAPGGPGSQWVRHPVSNHNTERDPKRSGSESSAALQLPRAQILCRWHHTLQTDRPGPTWVQTGKLSCRLSVCIYFLFYFIENMTVFMNLKLMIQSSKCCKHVEF